MKIQITTLDNGSRCSKMTEPVSGRKLVLDMLRRLVWPALLARVLVAFGAQSVF